MILFAFLGLSGALGCFLWWFINKSEAYKHNKRVKWFGVVSLWLGCGGSAWLCQEKFGGGTMSFVYFFVTVFMISFAIIDLLTMEVPANLLSMLFIIGVLSLFMNPNVQWYMNLFFGFGVALILFAIHSLSKGAFGLGDVCLITLIALILGWEQAFAVLMLALVLSGLAGAGMLMMGRVTKQTVMPFVPFIAVVQFGLLFV